MRPRLRLPGPAGDPRGDAVQPWPERFRVPHRAGLQRQDQEGRLERVIGRVPVAEQPAADPQDHRPVPPHDLLERGFRASLAARHEPFEQLPVAQAADDPDLEQRIQVAAIVWCGQWIVHEIAPDAGVLVSP